MAAAVAPASAPARSLRLYYLDHLKVFLTMLVIAHHVGQAYGPTGGFWMVNNVERWPVLGPFFYTNASFFLGLFFFISAYFMPGSFDRKGAGAFVKDRLLRFGIPVLFVVLITRPVEMYISYIFERGGTPGFVNYFLQVYLGLGPQPAGWTGPTWPEVNFGHTWFIEHLLVYGLIYAAWRVVWRRPAAPAAQSRAPGDVALLGFTLALIAVSGLVRIWYPIDRWIGLLGFIQMEPAHLPQYLSLFIFGTVAYRRNWLPQWPKALGVRWFSIGLLGALSVFLLMTVFEGMVPAESVPYVRLVAECFICVGFGVGLTVLSREYWNRTNAFWQTLSGDAFAAYVFHVPVLTTVQFLFVRVGLGAAGKFLLVTAISTTLAFLISHYVRKLPGVKAVL